MQRGIREHRIEFAVEIQVLSGHHPGVETRAPGPRRPCRGRRRPPPPWRRRRRSFRSAPRRRSRDRGCARLPQASAIQEPEYPARGRNARSRHSAAPTNAAANFVPCSDLHNAVVTRPAAASAANRQQKVEHHLPSSFPPPRRVVRGNSISKECCFYLVAQSRKVVVRGLVPRIHVLVWPPEGVDGRAKPGQDGVMSRSSRFWSQEIFPRQSCAASGDEEFSRRARHQASASASEAWAKSMPGSSR